MSNTYAHWETKFIQDKYKNLKYWDGIFSSEKYFWDRIGRPGMRVLDIGCASGNLFHALEEKYKHIEYVGVDGSVSLINRAKELTTEAKFINKDVFTLNKEDIKDKFDVVIATGVWQQEPKYKELLDIMLSYAKAGGCVLFDIKLFHNHKTLADINIAYGDHGDHRVHYIIFHYSDFINFIKKKFANLQRLEIYGYYTPVNFTVRLPKTVKEEVCSAHVLMQKKLNSGDSFSYDINLPTEFNKQII